MLISFIVDQVANQLIDEVLLRKWTPEDLKIVFAVATLQNAWEVEGSSRTVVEYFNRQLGRVRKAKLPIFGPRNARYYWHSFFSHGIALNICKTYLRFTGDPRMEKIDGLIRLIKAINTLFPFFWHNQFDFRTSAKPLGAVDKKAYIETVAEGMDRYLLRGEGRAAKRESPLEGGSIGTGTKS
jgi:hypothetical protein